MVSVREKTGGMSRRNMLRGLTAGAIACPICASIAGSALAEGAAHWTYEGHEGPEHWAELSPDFKSCELGVQQSPIDLAGPVPAKIGVVAPAFKPVPLVVLNNGHTIQVNCAPGGGSEIAGTRYELLQFHFHHPSEHLLNGKAFAMELHFVHKSAEGNLAVLGVLIRPGAENATLAPVWKAMPSEKGEPVNAGVTVDPSALLPKDHTYFRYYGSLTTPPCSEGVLWTVFAQPIEASAAQIRAFGDLFPMNARPAQSLNHRFLLETM